MGGQVSEVSDDDHAGPARGRHLERRRTSSAPRACSACARRPRRGSRSSFTPSWRCGPSGSPRRLMVELCGARLVPGTIDVDAEPPGAALDLAAGRAGRGAARDGDRAASRLHLPRAARLRRRARRATTSTVDGAAGPPLRRHPRGRPDRGGRRGSTASTSTCRRRCPARPDAGGLTREQRLRRRAEDMLRDLGFDEVVAWSFIDPAWPARLRLGAGRPARRRVAIPTRSRRSSP